MFETHWRGTSAGAGRAVEAGEGGAIGWPRARGPGKNPNNADCRRWFWPRPWRARWQTLLLLGGLLSATALAADPENATARSPARTQDEWEKAVVAGDAAYPYPPEELWQRVLQVLATPPQALSYRRVGEIFGLEFDEAKIVWLNGPSGEKSKKYYAVSNFRLATFPPPPFFVAHSQSRLAKGAGNLLSFELDVYSRIRFAPDQERAALRAELPAKYCVKPVPGDLEKLGYRYSQRQTMINALRTDRHGNPASAPTTFYVVSEEKYLENYITLTWLPNKCLRSLYLQREYIVDDQ